MGDGGDGREAEELWGRLEGKGEGRRKWKGEGEGKG
jgi:hypothetical protein